MCIGGKLSEFFQFNLWIILLYLHLLYFIVLIQMHIPNCMFSIYKIHIESCVLTDINTELGYIQVSPVTYAWNILTDFNYVMQFCTCYFIFPPNSF